MRERMTVSEKKGNKVLEAMVILLLSYILTAGVLLLLAFVLYKFRISENIVNFAVIVIYVLMTFFAGFAAGKRFKVKKFIWGLLLGSGYFLVLLLVSLVGGMTETVLGSRILTTYLLCAGGGMLGGMVS